MNARLLNVASGEHPAPGWVNFDFLPQRQLDLRADLFHLPFPDATFDKVYVGHTLEHLDWHTIPAALTELHRVMAPDAELMVVGPDIERALIQHQPRWLIDAILIDGPGSGPGGHKWTATALTTVIAVRTVFPNAREVPVKTVDMPAWPNPTTAGWQCAVQGAGEGKSR
jgi:predicted SAM-dependent methyltransferase